MKILSIRCCTLVLVMLLSVCARAQTPEKSDLPEIYLMPACRDCLSAAEIELASGVFSRNGKPFKIVSSQLILMDAHGEALFSIDDPYSFDGTAKIGRSTSGIFKTEFRDKLAQLGVGSYTAVVKVNELYSNVVSFNTQAIPRDFSYSDAPACPGSLSIEPLVDIHGKALPNAFMAYFRNLSNDSVSLAGSTARSRLLVDGKEYRLKILSWAGIADLWPGKSWGDVVDATSFVGEKRKRIAMGEHAVQYRFGDCLSNVIQVRVDKVEEK